MNAPAIAEQRLPSAQTLEEVLVQGNLEALTSEQRIQYVNMVCEKAGMNPLTRPFQFLRLSGRVVMYATKDATDQLRKIHGISLQIVEAIEDKAGILTVRAKATDKHGRSDEDIGCVSLTGLKGDVLSNARMK